MFGNHLKYYFKKEFQMKFKTLFRKNPLDEKDPGRYYPFPVYEGTIGIDDFVKEISHSTSLTATDVWAVVLEITEIFKRYLTRGHKVKLDGIGTFKVSFKGNGELTADALTALNIDRTTVRVSFVADPALKQELRGALSLSKLAGKSNVKKAEEKPAEDLDTQQD